MLWLARVLGNTSSENFCEILKKVKFSEFFFSKATDLQPAVLLTKNSVAVVFQLVLRNLHNRYFV